MMNWLICRYCQANIDRFLDGSLAVRGRRRVARHLDTCRGCYGMYARRRDLRRELQQDISLIGRGHAPDFARMWDGIQVEIPRHPARHAPFRYGFAALLLLLALVVPFTMGNHELTRAVPSLPVPQTEASTQTPASGDVPEVAATVAASSTYSSSLAQETAPPTLPEPDSGQ